MQSLEKTYPLSCYSHETIVLIFVVCVWLSHPTLQTTLLVKVRLSQWGREHDCQTASSSLFCLLLLEPLLLLSSFQSLNDWACDAGRESCSEIIGQGPFLLGIRPRLLCRAKVDDVRGRAEPNTHALHIHIHWHMYQQVKLSQVLHQLISLEQHTLALIEWMSRFVCVCSVPCVFF